MVERTAQARGQQTTTSVGKFLSNHIELGNVGNDFRCMKMDSQILGHVPASREALTIIVILPFFFLVFWV